MPLLRSGTEFANKWSALYASYRQEGIRDAIKVYEFMNRYYVQEGNKRVSVSKYGGSEYILADVTRILPKKSSDKDVVAYYEYLDFYKSTKNIHIVFTNPGSYARLANLLGQELGKPWSKQICEDLKAAYFSFRDKMESTLKVSFDFTMSDAFLMYISLFPMRTLFEDTREQIIEKIRQARKELLAGQQIEDIEFVTQAPEKEKVSGFLGLFSSEKRYTQTAPLKVAFVYDAGIETSRWINSHEAGRLYTEQMSGDNVVTTSYYAEGDLSAALERVVAEENELVFTVSPSMLTETLRFAVRYPEVSFFNCCIGKPHPSVICYHGKLYEAAFLSGILSADTLLRSGVSGSRRIGYLVRQPDELSAPTLNAFAVGVSLIDPECRISLKCIGEQTEEAIRSEWAEQNITIYADIEYPTCEGITAKPGVYQKIGEKEVCLCVPYFQWGKYYVQIVHAMLSGALRSVEAVNRLTSQNYWFGLSADVVSVRAPHLAYPTRKLLSFFRTAILSGTVDPFSGELHGQDGVIQEDGGGQRTAALPKMTSLPVGKIVNMNWLNENIDGTLPAPGEH